MACDSIQDGVILDFLDAGVKIAPLEADIRTQRKKYAVGEFRLSKEAGEAIAEHVPDDHPCVVRLGGEPAFRLVKQSDAVEFERTLHDKDVADLRLNGAGYITHKGVAGRNFSKATLRDIISYAYKQIDDEHNVLSGWRLVPPDINEENRFSALRLNSLESIIELVPGINEAPDELPGYSTFFEKSVEALDGNPASISLNDPTPAELLDEVADMFKLSWWVDTDGFLNVGNDTTYGSFLPISGYTDNVKLNRYSITSAANKINGVRVEGQYGGVLPQDHPNMDLHGGLTGARQIEDGRQEAGPPYLIAEARDPTIAGSFIGAEPNADFSSLDGLKALAEQSLFEIMMEQTSGSIEVNALSSTNQSGIANLARGDIVFIHDSVGADCDKDVVTGTYFVTSIHHLLSADRGWSVNIDVARVPDLANLESKAILYDPLSDKEYDTFGEYKNDTI